MIKNEDHKTTKWQRIGILAITALVIGSTFALYIGITLSYDAKSADSANKSAKMQRLEQVYSEYVTQTNAQAAELSTKYFDEFASFKSRVVAYNGADINELKATDLVIGDGEEVTDSNFTDYAAYYVGWLQDGTVFDSSFDDATNPSSLKTPLTGSTSMIQGWLEGIVGMKIGGIREIEIPYLMAYGDEGTDTIPAKAPLKFIIKLVPIPEPVPASDEMTQLYEELYGKVTEE